jgi:hypothetical protein
VRREKIGDCGGEGGIERSGVPVVVDALSRRSWSWLWRWVVRALREWESWSVGVSWLLMFVKSALHAYGFGLPALKVCV